MFATDSEFEDEVRRIARLLWPTAQYDGSAIEDGRERDGIFQTPDFVHVIECTVSRSKDKARDDTLKISRLIRKLTVKHQTKFVKGWFITHEEPTADQRSAVRETAAKEKLQGAQVVAVSFDQFRSQLVDARSYLTQREHYPFGSVRDPSTGDPKYTPPYVPLDLIDRTGQTYDVDRICGELEAGETFVLLGDYGAGKSVTMRAIFFAAATRFWQNHTLKFPILLNLRDHHGQTDPVEALERHARRVGFDAPSSLVRAWRGGFAILLLDGFDEIAAAGWAGKTKTLRELRFRSMELVRAFHRESSKGTGIALSGRAHFFDTDHEMWTALASRSATRQVNLAEFGQEQVAQFLGRMGWTKGVPAWLPSRPLLLAYLAARNLIDTATGDEGSSDPASGWDLLLERISQREAEIEAGIDASTVRALIERLSMLARNSVDGLGPLTPDAILDAFKEVCGYAPDDRGAVLLQRLPGLGAHHSEDGARVFIDKDFAEAARGSATFRVVENPYDLHLESETWQNSLLPLGAQVGAFKVTQAAYSPGKLIAALRRVIDERAAYTIAADLLLILVELGADFDDDKVFIKEVIIPELRLDESVGDLHAVVFTDCVIARLTISADFVLARTPLFSSCHFAVVEGRAGPRDLPAGRMAGCEVDSFEEAADTTNAILDLSLPLGTKVMLTVIKKLYAQSGAGRRQSALFRGLDSRAQGLVPRVLDILRRENLVTRSTRGPQAIWMPVRSGNARKRALGLLAAPTSSADPLVRMTRELD
jgi:hypothetical protein